MYINTCSGYRTRIYVQCASNHDICTYVEYMIKNVKKINRITYAYIGKDTPHWY